MGKRNKISNEIEECVLQSTPIYNSYVLYVSLLLSGTYTE